MPEGNVNQERLSLAVGIYQALPSKIENLVHR